MVFSMLLNLILIIVLIVIKYKTVTITDTKPNNSNCRNNWLQLQNEGCKYVKVKDDKVYLKIIK